MYTLNELLLNNQNEVDNFIQDSLINPKTAAIFWDMFNKKQFSLQQEQQLFNCLEAILLKEPKNALALTFVGVILALTEKPHKDIQKGLKYLQEAAELGNDRAINALGCMYHIGLGVTCNFSKAKSYYKQSSALGNAAAMTNLGKMYADDKKYSKAKDLYEKAQAIGNAAAMNNLGAMYQRGLGVVPNFIKARDFYDKAQALGDTSAMINLGLMYQNGVGVPKDYLKAKEQFDKALKLGHSDAQIRLENLNELIQKAEFAQIEEQALSLRQSLLYNNNAADELKSLQEKYPTEYAIQYHCVMALEPQTITELFNESPQIIGECIVKDPLLTKDEKFELLLDKFIDKSTQHLTAVALFASTEVREFFEKALEEAAVRESLEKMEADDLEKALSISNQITTGLGLAQHIVQDSLDKKSASSNNSTAVKAEPKPSYYEDIYLYDEAIENELIGFDDSLIQDEEPPQEMEHTISNFTFKFTSSEESPFIVVSISSEEKQAELLITPKEQDKILGCKDLDDLVALLLNIKDGHFITDMIFENSQKDTLDELSPNTQNEFNNFIQDILINPKAEAIFGDKLNNKQFTLQQEQQLLNCFEEILSKEPKNAQALTFAGAIYGWSQYSHRNNTNGFKYTNIASSLNNANATINLAHMYNDGVGVSRKPQEAIKLFEKLAEQNNAVALFCLGNMHEKGDDIPKNSVEAAYCYRRAFKLSYDNAKSKLISLQNLYKSNDKLQYHCTMALDPDSIIQNPGPMIHYLSCDELLTKEEINSIDNEFTERFLEKTVKNYLAMMAPYEIEQDKEALYLLGVEYQKGINRPINLVQAALCFRKSYALSNQAAKFKLAVLSNLYKNTDALIAYHCMQALEPENIATFPKQFPKRIVNYIFDDNLLTDREKYNLFFKLANGNLQKDCDPFTFWRMKQFIIQIDAAIPDDEFKIFSQSFRKNLPYSANLVKEALSLRKDYINSDDAALDKLKTLNAKNPGNLGLFYHYFMIKSPENIGKLFVLYPSLVAICLVEDSCLSDEEKYLLFVEVIFEGDKDKLVEFAYSIKGSANKVVQFIIEAFKKDESLHEVLQKNGINTNTQPHVNTTHAKPQLQSTTVATSTVLNVNEDIKHIMENPKDEKFFKEKVTNNLYTLEQELQLLQCLEKELLQEEESTRGCVLSMAGSLYAFTSKPHKDIQKGLKYLEEAAEVFGNDHAITYLGYIYQTGHDVPKDYPKAKDLYELAVAFNNSCAMVNLGLMYQEGHDDFPKDFLKAKELFEKAITLNQPDATICLEHLITLIQEEQTQQFEEALANGNEKAALEIFCRVYRISDTSNEKDPLLQRIATLIEINQTIKPVNHLYLVKLLEHENKAFLIETETLKAPSQDALSNYLEEILQKSINDHYNASKTRCPSILRGICAQIKENEKISHLFIPKLLEHENAVCKATEDFYNPNFDRMINKYRELAINTSSTKYKNYYTKYLNQCVTSYFKDRVSVNYVNLWTISQKIQNWELVKEEINRLPCCKPDSYVAIQYAINSPILITLLKELDFKAKSEGETPLLHAIIKSVRKSVHHFIDDTEVMNFAQAVEVLCDTLKKVAACDRRYFKARDIEGKGVIDYLKDLDTVRIPFHLNDQKDKINETIKDMVKVINEVIRNEKAFSNATQALFHYNSPFFEWPKDVKNEIAKAMEINL